ncbi:MAG TPA: LysR substrate-binding domain-containing protein [Gaiellaceae bacterium]|nr:LysR substrate-binding domain-containing protein [Gaiellaceae bacterium]
MLNVARLRLLRELAVTGSMAAAAESLSFTPSAISQQIAALERETDVTLIEKHGRGVRLTDAARTLVEHTELILNEIARAEADLDAVKHFQLGSLTIGAFPSSGTHLVPTAIRSFADRYPGVRIQLTELEPEQSLPLLQSGELDLALASEYDLVPLSSKNYEQETLLHDPMLVVHSDAWPEQHGAVDLADLQGERWIAPAPGTAIHEFTLRACQGSGFQPDITSTWTDFQVVQSLAAQGFGVAFVPHLALDPPRAGIVARPTSTPLNRRIFAAWRTGTTRAPLIAAIVEQFRIAAQTLT